MSGTKAAPGKAASVGGQAGHTPGTMDAANGHDRLRSQMLAGSWGRGGLGRQGLPLRRVKGREA